MTYKEQLKLMWDGIVSTNKEVYSEPWYNPSPVFLTITYILMLVTICTLVWVFTFGIQGA